MIKEIVFGLILSLMFFNIVGAANISELSFNDSSGFKGKTNDVLEKEIKIPENLQLTTRILFGLRADEKVDFQTFIILIALWVFVLLLVHSGAELFINDWKSWGVSILFVLMGSYTGGIRIISDFLIDLSHLFGALENNSLLSFFIVLMILFVILFVLLRFFRAFRNRNSIDQMSQAGRTLNLATRISRIRST